MPTLDELLGPNLGQGTKPAGGGGKTLDQLLPGMGLSLEGEEEVLNEPIPDEDFPSRALLQLGTTGPEQIARELGRKGFQAEVKDGNIKVRSKKTGKLHNFDLEGWQGFGELGRDITDVVPEVVSGVAQVGGALGGAALAGPTANPFTIGAAGVAGAGAASGATDFLRTQVLGRALGYKPELGESLRSAGTEAAIGATAELGGLAFRPLIAGRGFMGRAATPLMKAANWASKPGSAALRIGGAMLRAPAAAEQFLTRTLTGVPASRNPLYNFVRRYGPAYSLYAPLSGSLLQGLKIQAGIHAAHGAGSFMKALGGGYFLRQIGNRAWLTAAGAPAAPPTISRALFRVSDALERSGINAGKAALTAALRIPGVKEWLEEKLGATPVASGGPQPSR